jgi:photosystem II stability/assembly factor-like uncharacterized protein
MRGPKEETRGAAGAAQKPASKVLARLRQFEMERELGSSLVEEAGAESQIVVAVGDLGAAAPQAPGVDGEISPYLAAFYQMQAAGPAEEAEKTGMPIPQGWRPLGPFSVPHGQTYGSGTGSRPAISGRVSSIAVDPGNESHVLVGSAGGGIWETRDGSATYHPRTDNQPSCAIGAIAFDPANPSVVYAGTGEGNFFRRLGVGLLKSTDGGTSWVLIATSPFSGIGFYDLMVDPSNSNRLFAATTGGLFVSTNGGVTWTQQRSQMTWALSIGHLPGGGGGTQEIFAACADGLFGSTDGGATWAAVALAGAPGGLARMEVAHAPSDPNIAYVFAADNAGAAYLWRRNSANAAFGAETLPAVSTGQAWYDWFLAVAPNNPDVIYLGEITAWRGTRAGNNWTWVNIASKTTGDSIHPDQHAIAISPSNPDHIFVGCDGGIFFSPDRGDTWRAINKGLCITEFEYLAQHPQYDAWLIGGTQDNGTERYEGEEMWYHVQDGDGGDCGINAASPYTCYHTFYNMGMERSTAGGAWGSWTFIGPTPPAGHQNLFYPPVEVNASVVVQAGSTVFISSDTGTTWNPVNLPAGVASALAIPNATRVYAGTIQGNIYRIDFSGGAWQAPVALTQPRAGWVSGIRVDPTNPNRIWVTYSSLTGGHVFRSNDGGTTWTNVSAGLPNIPANAVQIDPANPDTVWVAADVGVYRSSDAGATWGAFSNLLPNALAKDLVFVPSLRLLRVALQSRGVWEIAVDQATMPDVEVYIRDSVLDTGRLSPSQSGPDPFNSGSNTYWWECTDVKVDSPPFQQPAASDVDFVVFNDDHGVFASGLMHENAERNRTVRVFVQVHNRGPNPAQNVAVKVFFADASAGLPDLPSGFWTGFPNNSLPAGSPWQAIAPHQTVPALETGRPAVVGFEWPVPAGAAGHTCLLAIITAGNDPVGTTELNVGTLVTTSKKCGLKNLTVVDAAAAPIPMIKLDLWGSKKSKWFSIHIDEGDGEGRRIRALVLSKRLTSYAEKAGLKRTKLTPGDLQGLEKLIKENRRLGEDLDLEGAFQISKQGKWLPEIELDAEKPDPVVVLLDPKAPAGRVSIIQWDEGKKQPAGGFTVELRPGKTKK